MSTNITTPVPEFELRGIIAVLRRQYRVIFYTFVLIFGMAGVFLISVTPIYTASALIFVDPEQKNILDSGPALSGSVGSDNARVDSEVEILRSDAVALAVIATQNLMTDAEFGPRPGFRAKLASAVGIAHAATVATPSMLPRTLVRFRKAVAVKRRGLTYLISVAVSSQSPERAAELSNTMTTAYVTQQVQAKINAALAARDALQGHLEVARQTVATYEDVFDVFIERNLARIKPGAQQVEFAALRTEMELTRTRLLEKSGTLDDVAYYLEAQDWQALAQSLGDQALIRLETDRQALLEQVENRAEAGDLRQALEAIEADLAQKSAVSLTGLSDEIDGLGQSAATLRGQLRETLLSSEFSPELLTEIYALQQESGIARSQYQVLLSRMRALETQAHIQIADSRVVSPALPPAAPTFPNRTLVLLAALALSSGLGISLAFLNEYYIGGVTSATQLSELLQMTTAATVPFSQEMNAGRLSVAEKIVDAPLSLYSESVRKIRAAVDQGFRRQPPASETVPVSGGRIILVTSSLAGEGKTTTALALARTYATAGKKTLLIDGDLRKPALHRLLGFQPEVGFLDYLRDPEQTELSNAFYARDPASDLALIMGAGRSEFATDQLLNSATFEALMEQARNVYDITIIDSPPLLPVVDARYIAPHVDAVVMLVKWAATSQADLRAAVQPLRDAMRDDAGFYPVLAQSEARVQPSRYNDYYEGYSAAT
ncbi:MAG: GumC family protein [Paracoccaceae bacterium]